NQTSDNLNKSQLHVADNTRSKKQQLGIVDPSPPMQNLPLKEKQSADFNGSISMASSRGSIPQTKNMRYKESLPSKVPIPTVEQTRRESFAPLMHKYA
ncbi:hypothetical protein KI387_025719, partial [Taxus chinensis]